MKKSTKIVVISFNVLAIPLFLYLIIAIILEYGCGIMPYLFNEVGDFYLIMIFIAGIVLEGLMLIALSIIKRKIWIFLTVFVLVPLVYGLLYVRAWGSSYRCQEAELKKYDRTLIFADENLFHHNRTYLYVKTSPITCEEVAYLGYDHPLRNRECYDIYEYDNGIEIEYDDLSLFLKYENNKFIEVKTKEEIL